MSFGTSSRRSANFIGLNLDRRQLIGGLGVGCLSLVAGPAVIGRARAQAPRWTADPFSPGVASGGPRPDGFVLGTRLAPRPPPANPAAPARASASDVPVAPQHSADEARG